MCFNGVRTSGSKDSSWIFKKLSENAQLPFGKLMALSKVEGLRYPHPPPC
jgi:hypothetical protein